MNEALRKLITHEIERSGETTRTLLDEHSAAFKWLLGSLLAVNGGGLLAVKDHIGHGPWQLTLAPILFLSGIVAALMTGYLSQKANRALIGPSIEMTIFWISSADEDEIDQLELEKINDKIQLAVKAARPTQIAGWASSIAFIIGSLVAGTGLYYAPVTASPAGAPTAAAAGDKLILSSNRSAANPLPK